MANNNNRTIQFTGILALVVAGLWAAGLTPLDAVGIEAGPKGTAPTTQLKTLSAKAGRRITTVTIETSDPVSYLTNRPDPNTLLVDLREVDAAKVMNSITEAKGVVSGVSVESAVAPDGARLTRVRIRLTQPAAHQVRAKRNLIYVDLDSAFPLGSVGTVPRTAGGAQSPVPVATTLDQVHTDIEPNGASVTGRAPLAQQQPTTPVPPLPPPINTGMPQPGTPQPRFNGHPVTLDFQGADLRTVLRTFADISGLNIVIDQSVQGTVDVSLH